MHSPDFSQVQTPALLIDMPTVARNIARCAAYAREAGVALRPHIKTHKLPRLARMQLDAGACGLTCAKVSEAEVMADAGMTDLFIAHAIIGAPRLARVMRLARRANLILGIDSAVGADMLQSAAQSAGLICRVRLEIDTGLLRTGVPIAESAALARHILALPNLQLDGIYTFKTTNLDGQATADTAAAGAQEGALLKQCADLLRAQGIAVPHVSGGSSPTGRYVARMPGITEVRPGTYIYNDCMQTTLGAATWDDCAATVLATVVSTPQPGLAIVDAGSKALSTDSVLGAPPYFLRGWGHILGRDDLTLARLYEEHGILTGPADMGLTIGQQLRIVPNHVCVAVNLYNEALLIEADGALTPTRIAARGCSQ